MLQRAPRTENEIERDLADVRKRIAELEPAALRVELTKLNLLTDNEDMERAFAAGEPYKVKNGYGTLQGRDIERALLQHDELLAILDGDAAALMNDAGMAASILTHHAPPADPAGPTAQPPGWLHPVPAADTPHGWRAAIRAAGELTKLNPRVETLNEELAARKRGPGKVRLYRLISGGPVGIGGKLYFVGGPPIPLDEWGAANLRERIRPADDDERPAMRERERAAAARVARAARK